MSIVKQELASNAKWKVKINVIIGVINHCQEANPMSNNVPQKVFRAKEAWLHDLGWSTRTWMSNSPSIKGLREEAPNRTLATWPNLQGSTLCHKRVDPSIKLKVFAWTPKHHASRFFRRSIDQLWIWNERWCESPNAICCHNLTGQPWRSWSS